MAWRKQSPPAAARAAGGHDRAARGSGRMAEFCSGLHSILLQVDAVAFRRYLAEWEDVIGDTAELAATSEDQLQRTMRTLLRRPQQFNLPAWPAVALPARRDADGDEGRGAAALPRHFPDVTPPARPAWPALATPAPPVESKVAPVDHPVEEQATRNGEPGNAGVYQLDMVTGELIAIPERALAEPEPAPYGVAGEPKPAARPRRRRRSTSGMRQLTFWPPDEHPCTGQ